MKMYSIIVLRYGMASLNVVSLLSDGQIMLDKKVISYCYMFEQLVQTLCIQIAMKISNSSVDWNLEVELLIPTLIPIPKRI